MDHGERQKKQGEEGRAEGGEGEDQGEEGRTKERREEGRPKGKREEDDDDDDTNSDALWGQDLARRSPHPRLACPPRSRKWHLSDSYFRGKRDVT